MQNKTLMLMAIARKRGEGFVVEKKQTKEYVETTVPRTQGHGTYISRTRKEKEVLIAVKSRASGGSLVLIEDSIYDADSWSIACKVHEHATKKGKLLVTLIPEYGYNQFCNEAETACAETNVPLVRVRPNLTHDAALEYFDFAIWQTVRDAANKREVELDMNRCLQRANDRARERELYALFFGLKWPAILRSAPADLEELTTAITRKRIEGNKQELPEYRKEWAKQIGQVTPFWMQRRKS